MSAGFVAVAPDGRGFVRDGRPFVPWGLNYDRSYHRGADVLLEELLERDPAKLDADFARARAWGANTIRLFLQHARYQPQPGRIEARALEGLDVAVAAARRQGLLVDLTGLSHIDTSAPATWYATASDAEILAAEAHFWEALARHFAEEPAIFCFNLQNEPTVNWQDRPLDHHGVLRHAGWAALLLRQPPPQGSARRVGEWVRGHYAGPEALARAWADFPTPVEDWEHIEPPPGERRGDPRLLDFQAFREDYAERWTRTLVTAIRRHDRRHLITIGLLPSSVPLIGPARQYSGFAPGRLAPYLDFLAIHLYPQRAAPPGEVLEANLTHHELVLLALLAGSGGKPVVVEEWFALGEGLRQGHISWGGWFDAFLGCSRPLASGWVSFYHALLNDRPGAAVAPAYQEWLERFRATGRAVEDGDFPGPRRAEQGREQGREQAGGADFVLDGPALLTSGAARAEALDAYGALRGGAPSGKRAPEAGPATARGTLGRRRASGIGLRQGVRAPIREPRAESREVRDGASLREGQRWRAQRGWGGQRACRMSVAPGGPSSWGPPRWRGAPPAGLRAGGDAAGAGDGPGQRDDRLLARPRHFRRSVRVDGPLGELVRAGRRAGEGGGDRDRPLRHRGQVRHGRRWGQRPRPDRRPGAGRGPQPGPAGSRPRACRTGSSATAWTSTSSGSRPSRRPPGRVSSTPCRTTAPWSSTTGTRPSSGRWGSTRSARRRPGTSSGTTPPGSTCGAGTGSGAGSASTPSPAASTGSSPGPGATAPSSSPAREASASPS